MANIKKLSTTKIPSGCTAYCIVRRETDGYLLSGDDGTFVAAPSNMKLRLVEDTNIPGLYEIPESRVAWSDGRYKAFIYALGSVSITPPSGAVALGGIAPTVS